MLGAQWKLGSEGVYSAANAGGWLALREDYCLVVAIKVTD
jgi:hypothetical protein